MTQKKVEGSVSPPLNTSSIDKSAIYTEAGRQLRHYSTNRLAVYSFSIPLCFGIGALALSADDSIFRFYLFITEIVIFVTSVYSAIIFSTLVSSIRSRLVKMEQGGKLLLHTHIRNYFVKMNYDLDKFDWMVCILGVLFNIMFIFFIISSK